MKMFKYFLFRIVILLSAVVIVPPRHGNSAATTGSPRVSYLSLPLAGSMKWRIILRFKFNLSSLVFSMILFYHKFHDILLFKKKIINFHHY